MKARYYILVVGLGLYVLNCYNLSQISTSSTPDTILKKSNPIEKALTWGRQELWQDTKIDINFVWGVKPAIWQDSSRSKWQSQDKGMLELDSDFNPAKPDNQMAMYNFCVKLRLLNNEGYQY